MKRKYVIVSIRGACGGVIALHNLCYLLNELGEDARVLYSYNVHYNGNRLGYVLKCLAYNIKVSIKYIIEEILGPEKLKNYFDIPFRKIRRKYLPFVDDNTVVVYSEDMYGNPLRAKNVVRWLLWYNKVYKRIEDNTFGYDINDLFFTYSEAVNDYILNPECRILRTPYYNLDLYKKTNYGERKGKCYIIRKGALRKDLPTTFDGEIIDSYTEQHKVRVFNECEYCISYDTLTAYSSIAAICGCISVVVPEDGKSRGDYLASAEKGYGRAYGFVESEIRFAKETQKMVREEYLWQNEESENEVKRFIQKCDNYFFNL